MHSSFSRILRAEAWISGETIEPNNATDMVEWFMYGTEICPRHEAGAEKDAALDDVAAVIDTCGCRASSRSSSWPVYPVAPATATRAGSERRPSATTLPGATAVCIGKNTYTVKYEWNQ